MWYFRPFIYIYIYRERERERDNIDKRHRGWGKREWEDTLFNTIKFLFFANFVYDLNEIQIFFCLYFFIFINVIKIAKIYSKID